MTCCERLLSLSMEGEDNGRPIPVALEHPPYDQASLKDIYINDSHGEKCQDILTHGIKRPICRLAQAYLYRHADLYLCCVSAYLVWKLRAI